MTNPGFSRSSILGAALFLLVIGCLLYPIGIIVRSAVADSGGGTPSTSVVPDPISDSVAAIPAEFRVDESGAATYSIPIYAVPGTAGVTPQLSLNYSSQGGYGPLGKGWSIGGVSMISRCRATREAGDFISGGVPVDGNPNPINYSNSTDKLCLDGQRLIHVSNSPACPAASGMTVYQYRTEVESFQRICGYLPSATPDNGLAFLTVERKDGSISWYGDRNSNASANRADGYVETNAPGHASKALVWAQTRFQDSTGNYIDYLYSENAGAAGAAEHLLSEVQYTGKTVLPGQVGSAMLPYAKIAFHYTSLPSTKWGLGHSAGGATHTQRWRLTSITSCASTQVTCSAGNQARFYRLDYATTDPSGSGLDILGGITECRDSSETTCAAPTVFEWSTGKHEFATVERPANVALANDHIRGFKTGDINGDGRQDVAFQYLAGSGCSGGTWIVSTTSVLNAGGTPTFANSYFNCIPANIVSRGDGAWHLLDYNGDGLDDLFVSSATGTGWRVHPSTGNGFDTAQNLISGVLIPSHTSKDDQVQLTDLNGDGLIDVVYPSGGYLRARVMERQGGSYAWGGERTVTVNSGSFGVTPCESNPGEFRFCTRQITGVPTPKTQFVQLADFNGDAVSDLLIRVQESYQYRTGNCPIEAVPPSQSRGSSTEDDGLPYVSVSQPVGDPTPLVGGPNCWETQSNDSLHAVSLELLTTGHFNGWNYDAITTGNPESIVLADINGDGLTDAFARAGSATEWYYRINNGLYMASASALPLSNYREHARFADVNGDGRTDLLYLVESGGNKVYYVRRSLPGGGFATGAPLAGGNARLCEGGGCNPAERSGMFGDVDGDGNLDFLSFNFASSNLGLYVSRSNGRFAPRDVITQFTNGFGASTFVAYAPLTIKDLYRRDSNSRNTTNWGRGSPVSDLLAPMYAVAHVSSSSPRAGDADAMATVHYRYAGARMQAGGRGFLGFQEIVTFDPNQSADHHVITSTTYWQEFPFIGMPESTVKRVVSGTYQLPSCLYVAVTDSCFVAPGQPHPSLGGSIFSSSTQVWEADSDIGAGFVGFAPGVQAPVHVRTAGTVEILRDPFTGSDTSRVETFFDYGAYGNVSLTGVDTKTGGGSLVSTVTTSNVYSNSTTLWRLGRLTSSTVTHQRPSRDDVVRTATFAYDLSGATTGQLVAERVQSGAGDSQDLRTDYDLDEHGNRIKTITCAAPATNCQTAAFAFQPTTTARIHRTVRTVYDSRGRYPIETWEPFRTSSGSAETRTQRVVDRDIFGNVTRAYNLNGVDSFAVPGAMGRAYYTWTETVPGSVPGDPAGGVAASVAYRWCGTGSGQVPCPAGAKFRQQTTATAAPVQWSYYDVLGRPILQVTQSFNIGISGKDATAVCTAYDATGKPKQVSNPFFLPGTSVSGPSLAANVCTAATLKWTTTTYDVLGRPTNVESPKDGGGTISVATAYSNLTTTTTDPRGNATVQTRNALGELTKVTDALGTDLVYSYYADGTLFYTHRDVGRGQIRNTFVYDTLGRKIQQSDPDGGITQFEYNALGELLAQVDSAGNRIENWYDARGRVWRKVAKRADGLTESESQYAWDTAANGRGQLASESISGTYDAWIGQAGMALDFGRSYSYDTLGRALGSTTVIDGASYSSAAVYDGLGRAWKAQDASGRWLKTQFTARGHALAVCNSSASDVDPLCPNNINTYQRTMETDAWGHVVNERRGNRADMDVTREYWPDSGRLAGICAGNASTCQLMDEGYAWDNAGNLSTQIKEDRYQEDFTYDALNRLKDGRLVWRNGVAVNLPTVAFDYDGLGNICRKRMRDGTLAVYHYVGRAGCGRSEPMNSPYGSGTTNTAGAHQVRQQGADFYYYDASGQQTLRDAASATEDRHVKYSFDGHAYEVGIGNPAAPTYRARFWHGPDGHRYKAVHTDIGQTVLYIGNVEVVKQGTTTKYRRNIAGVMQQDVVGSTATNQYLWHDQLGSLVRITDANGVAVSNLDYVAQGERRNHADPTSSSGGGGATAVTYRGFTGHEMFGRLGIIHMNARLYDAELGRFLSPDPVIQAPNNLQSWNAYTYVFNNPLAYTDPTGMISLRQVLGIVIAAVGTYFFPWGAVWWKQLGYAMAVGAASGYVSTGTMQGAVWGAFSAAAFYGIGQGFQALAEANKLANGASFEGVFGTGLTSPQFAGKVLSHGMAGGVMSKLQGGKFGHGFASAGVAELVSPMIDGIGPGRMHPSYAPARVAVAAVVGGTVSAATGGKFANGAITAAFGRAFNAEGGKGFATWLKRMLHGTAAHMIVQGSEFSYALEQGWEVAVEFPIKKPWSLSYGYADLMLRKSPLDQWSIFEIKPGTQNTFIRRILGETQVSNYVRWINNKQIQPLARVGNWNDFHPNEANRSFNIKNFKFGNNGLEFGGSYIWGPGSNPASGVIYYSYTSYDGYSN